MTPKDEERILELAMNGHYNEHLASGCCTEIWQIIESAEEVTND